MRSEGSFVMMPTVFSQFFGFQIGTQIILRQHRRVAYVSLTESEQLEITSLQNCSRMKRVSVWVLTFLLVSGFAMYLAGCLVYIFSIINKLGANPLPPINYSIASVGTALMDSAVAGGEGRLRWLQIVWFLLGVAMPLLSNSLYLILLWKPMSKFRLEQLLFASEIAFAWSSAEVFILSTIFAVSEIPTFGNGLIESGCSYCYVVDSKLLPELAVIIVGALASTVASVWLFQVAHKTLYAGRERYPVTSRRGCPGWSCLFPARE